MRTFLVAGLMLLLVPASASAWSDSVRVGSQAVEWISPQTFGKRDMLKLRILVGGRDLQDLNGLARCRSHRYGAGIAVTFDACGRHLKLRFANSGAPKTVRILYRRM